MRFWIAIPLVACTACSNHLAGIDGAGDPTLCKAQLETMLDRACAMPTDCVLVESEDCCGPVELGIRAGTEGSFPTAEHQFEACLACPPLGCNHAPLSEDGRAPSGGQTIVATCFANRCRSVVQ
jgi:hypothetical protein